MWYLAIFMTSHYDLKQQQKKQQKKTKKKAMVFWGLGCGWGVTNIFVIYLEGGVEYFFPTGFARGGGSSKILPTTWKCNQPPLPHLVINDSSLNTCIRMGVWNDSECWFLPRLVLGIRSSVGILALPLRPLYSSISLLSFLLFLRDSHFNCPRMPVILPAHGLWMGLT